jgi:FkbH-like protein
MHLAVEVSVLGISIFRKSINVQSGWSENISEIRGFKNDTKSLVRLVPNGDTMPELLLHTLNMVVIKNPQFFDLTSFLVDVPIRKDNKQNILKFAKCVVWDLDGTLWDGVLMESGENPQMKLRDNILETLKTLDSRGILNSIASKNDSSDALAILDGLGISDLFVSPQINWNPKSANISLIAQQLNLDVSEFLFVDDSQFEIQEVSRIHRDIETLNASETSSMLGMAFLNPPLSSLGSSRRQLYVQNAKRRVDEVESNLSYQDFLASCHMQLNIRNLDDQQDFERGFELLSRSNQLNLSGLRLTFQEYEKAVSEESSLWVCADLQDKYGSHGVVLVGKIDFKQDIRIAELAISCRVAGKYVEEAFFQWVIDSFSSNSNLLELGFIQTPKNGLIRDAIDRSGFHFDSTSGIYKVELPKEIENSRIVSVKSNL